jgi:uncharacterized Zn finger protein
MSERSPVSLAERWRREANRGIDPRRLEQALATLPSVRNPKLRVRGGAIQAEMEGAMGSIHEVSLRVPTLPGRSWPQVARVMRRSPSMMHALEAGRVPRAFDRLVARITGEPLFPEARRVSSGCSCGDPAQPCRHALALHELFARRLDERPWLLLTLRGADAQDLLARARSTQADETLPKLAFGTVEEPLLFPEGEEGDLEYVLTREQIARLVGSVPDALVDAAVRAVESCR